MNDIFKGLFAIILVGMIVGIASCTKVCDVGYEGGDCKTPVRDKYLGTFSGTETCGSVSDTFSVAFSKVASDIKKIQINNIYNSTLNATGTVLENGSITIAPQSFGTGTISGSVTFNDGKLRLGYVIGIPGLPNAGCTWQQN